MKLKTLLLTTALVAAQVVTTAPASAEKKPANHSDEYYAKLEAGTTMPERIRLDDSTTSESLWIRNRTGFAGGLGVGYSVCEYFRTDLMLQYRNITTRTRQDGTTFRINTFNAMLNGYVDGHNDSIFTPYLMAGVGVGRNNTRLRNAPFGARFRQTNFVWNVGAGAQVKAADQVSLDLGYRYVSLGRLGSTTTLNNRLAFRRDFRTHEVLAGLIWRF